MVQYEKEGLIRYIKAHDASYQDINPNNHSLLELAAIKTEIEIRISYSSREITNDDKKGSNTD